MVNHEGKVPKQHVTTTELVLHHSCLTFIESVLPEIRPSQLLLQDLSGPDCEPIREAGDSAETHRYIEAGRRGFGKLTVQTFPLRAILQMYPKRTFKRAVREDATDQVKEDAKVGTEFPKQYEYAKWEPGAKFLLYDVSLVQVAKRNVGAKSQKEKEMRKIVTELRSLDGKKVKFEFQETVRVELQKEPKEQDPKSKPVFEQVERVVKYEKATVIINKKYGTVGTDSKIPVDYTKIGKSEEATGDSSWCGPGLADDTKVDTNIDLAADLQVLLRFESDDGNWMEVPGYSWKNGKPKPVPERVVYAEQAGLCSLRKNVRNLCEFEWSPMHGATEKLCELLNGVASKPCHSSDNETNANADDQDDLNHLVYKNPPGHRLKKQDWGMRQNEGKVEAAPENKLEMYLQEYLKKVKLYREHLKDKRRKEEGLLRARFWPVVYNDETMTQQRMKFILDLREHKLRSLAAASARHLASICLASALHLHSTLNLLDLTAHLDTFLCTLHRSRALGCGVL